LQKVISLISRFRETVLLSLTHDEHFYHVLNVFIFPRFYRLLFSQSFYTYAINRTLQGNWHSTAHVE